MINNLLIWIRGKIDLPFGFSMNSSATKELLNLAKDRWDNGSLAGYWQAIYDAAEVSLGFDDEEDPARVSELAMKFHERTSGEKI